MTESWTKIFDDLIASRHVTGEIYGEGGYKISTTQKSKDDGSVSGDESSTVVVSPTEAGNPIEFHSETLEELEIDLVSDGEFSTKDAKSIVDRFRS